MGHCVKQQHNDSLSPTVGEDVKSGIIEMMIQNQMSQQASSQGILTGREHHDHVDREGGQMADAANRKNQGFQFLQFQFRTGGF